MGTTAPVFHTTARAISHVEFLEALQAACPPRFPFARGPNARQVAIAVSGGVDSMALAFMCSRARKTGPVRVSDNPVSSFFAYTVDHGLRDNSTDEARRVVQTLKQQMGLYGDVLRLRWKRELPAGVQARDLPNIESVARRLRYRRLAQTLRVRLVGSLLLAHHADDQHETVLTRLLAGHGVRGLRGMRAANDIPECYDVHGAYQSGFLDDQASRKPFYVTAPTRQQRARMRGELRAESMDPDTLARDLSEGVRADAELAYLEDVFDASVRGSRWAPPLAPLDVEDGGIRVYRPLLGFGKDRLIATCLENNVPWFEDATNSDPGLTTRNALRHLSKHHELPVALQKPAILQLAARCNAKIAALDAEVGRLVRRSVVAGFRAAVGTVVVQLPHFTLPSPYRNARRSATVRERRLKHYRDVAGQLVRRMITLVAPDNTQLPAPVHQPWIIARLFPSLASLDTDLLQDGPSAETKSFSLAHVHFIPLPAAKGDKQAGQVQAAPGSTPGRPARGLSPTRWYLTRAPYPSNTPPPALEFAGLAFRRRWRKPPERWQWSAWSYFGLWDGRFWIRLRSRLPERLRVAPFAAEHAKPFREALADDGARAYLAASLKRYAPGKVRYTLPAVYMIGDDKLQAGLIDGTEQSYWGPGLGGNGSSSTDSDGDSTETTRPRPRLTEVPKVLPPLGTAATPSEATKLWIDDVAWEWQWKRDVGTQTGRLLALPTLGVQIPGSEAWFQCQVRYRKVDTALLEQSLPAAGLAEEDVAVAARMRGGRRRAWIAQRDRKQRQRQRQRQRQFYRREADKR